MAWNWSFARKLSGSVISESSSSAAKGNNWREIVFPLCLVSRLYFLEFYKSFFIFFPHANKTFSSAEKTQNIVKYRQRKKKKKGENFHSFRFSLCLSDSKKAGMAQNKKNRRRKTAKRTRSFNIYYSQGNFGEKKFLLKNSSFGFLRKLPFATQTSFSSLDNKFPAICYSRL